MTLTAIKDIIIRKLRINSLLLGIIPFLLFSCNPVKRVPENDYLLYKSKIRIEDPDLNKDDLKGYVRQKPNKRILGVRFHLGLYNLAKPGKEKGLSKWLKTIGEEPVLYDPYMTNKSVSQLKTYLNNKGYYDARVEDSVVFKKKKAKVYYRIKANEPYTIKSIGYTIKDSLLLPYIMKDTVNSYIQKDEVFDVELLDNERQRIEDLLKNQGYYYFNKEYLHYKADSNSVSREVDLELVLEKARVSTEDSTLITNHRKFYVRNIYVYANYDPRRAIEEKETYLQNMDTTIYDGIHFIEEEGARFNKKVFLQSNFINPGDLYQKDEVKQTHQHLTDLRLFKIVNIQFREADTLSADSNLTGYLDCQIQLTKFMLQNYRLEIVGTNNSGNIGIGGNLLYQHKSLFGGAEIADFKLNGSIETLDRQKISRITNTVEFGSEVNIRIPKFLLPVFRAERFSRLYNPKTNFLVGYNYQDRPDYNRTIANFAFGYNWEGRRQTSHVVNPIELNAVKLPYASDDFRDYIDSSFLRSSYENHLVSATSYSFVFNNQDIRKNKDFYFFRMNMEFSGNIITGVNELLGTNTVDGSYQLFGIPYSQYYKMDVDFRYYQILDPANSLAYRFFAGAGFPYGNADALPFEKKYFSGGANSIRAWNVRDLGPGSYSGGSITRYPNQTADIKLEANVEYRFQLFWQIEGALFLDAGNIWAINPEGREGALFKRDEFYKEIAVGTGFGARLDLSFFVFRLDLGLKLRDPAMAENRRWIPDSRGFQSSDLTLNVGIGYPF